MNLGDTKAASASLQKSLAMREDLARSNPRNRSDQVELAVAYLDYSGYQARADSVSSGYDYARRALAILEREVPSAPDELRIVNLSAHVLRLLGEMQVGEGLSGSIGSRIGGAGRPAESLPPRGAQHRVVARGSPFRIQQARIEIVLGDAFLKLGDRPRRFPITNAPSICWRRWFGVGTASWPHSTRRSSMARSATSR